MDAATLPGRPTPGPFAPPAPIAVAAATPEQFAELVRIQLYAAELLDALDSLDGVAPERSAACQSAYCPSEAIRTHYARARLAQALGRRPIPGRPLAASFVEQARAEWADRQNAAATELQLGQWESEGGRPVPTAD